MVDGTGRVKPCCRFLEDHRPKNHTLDNHSIQDIFDSDFQNDLRKRILAGERLEGCTRCYEEEDNNKKSLRMRLNEHPKVGAHFKRWIKKQEAPYVLKEVAIIFENNLQNQYDYIITVVANEEERIKRVIQRDRSSRSSLTAIIENQLSDKEKIKKSDFVIENNNLEVAKAQAKKIHKKLIYNI